MKQLFAIGQEITPKVDHKSWTTLSFETSPIPKFGQTYHVASYEKYQSYLLISLREFPRRYVFQQEGFAPVVSDSVLSKELEEIFQ